MRIARGGIAATIGFYRQIPDSFRHADRYCAGAGAGYRMGTVGGNAGFEPDCDIALCRMGILLFWTSEEIMIPSCAWRSGSSRGAAAAQRCTHGRDGARDGLPESCG